MSQVTQKAPDLIALLSRQEPLLPALAKFLGTEPFLSVKHPLVYSVPHSPALNAMLNASFQAKRAAVAEARACGQFERYVWLHERPYRVNAFMRVAAGLDDARYWRLLREVYQDSENVEELPRLWRRILLAPRGQREAMMDPEERAHLESLPDTLTLWRGASHDQELRAGFGWSLSKRVALWFARRTASPTALLARAEVSKSSVLAYLGSRGEDEIVVAFEHVRQLRYTLA